MMRYYLRLFLFIAMGFFACNQVNTSSETADPKVKDAPKTDYKATVADKNKYLISNSQVGPFIIGEELPGPATMRKYQVKVEQKTRHTEEGPVTESVTIIAENGHELLWLKPGLLAGADDYDHKIREIIVVSPLYKTKEKIGIGSTIADFQTTYPVHQVWYTYVSEMYVLETDQVQAQFILKGEDYTGPKPEIISDQSFLRSSDFKSTGKIQRVRIILVGS